MTPNQIPPQGNVTFLFTDLEGSMRIAKSLGQRFSEVMQAHNVRLRDQFVNHMGYEVASLGDGFVVAFQKASDAVLCAVSIQNSLAQEPIIADEKDKTGILRLRIGIHTTHMQIHVDTDGSYHGMDLNLTARVASIATGGQILVTESVYRAIPQGNYSWYVWKARHLKGFDAAQDLYELLWDNISRGEPGTRWLPTWYREVNRYILRSELEQKIIGKFVSTSSSGNNARLVTLHGMGGMGKTRLAIECALRMAALFADGIYFVPLASVPFELGGKIQVEAVAEAIGLALGMTGAMLQQRDFMTRLRNSESMLILDNFENVNHPEVVRFIAELLNETFKLRLLVTGREALRIMDMEHLVLVGGMTEEEAVILFTVRAEAKGYDWQHTQEEEETIRRIVRLLEYSPLAIELVTAHLPYHELIEIADSIEQQPLSAMTEAQEFGVKNISERHLSLRRSLDWSFALLDSETQEAFARLGIFQDSFNIQSVAAICNLSDSQRLLPSLQNAAMLNRYRERGRSRYTMLRPVRAYAQEKFACLPDAEVVRQRYVAYFVQAAQENRNINDVSQGAFLNAERRNIIYAVEVAEQQQDWASIYNISEALNKFLLLRGLWSEREQLNLRALVAARNEGRRQQEGIALNNLGNVYRLQGRWNEAIDCYEQDLAIGREFGDRMGEGQTLNNLGVVYQTQGRWSEAEVCYQESLAIKRSFGDSLGEGATLNNMGTVYQAQERVQEAEACYQQSLTISRMYGDRIGEAQALANLGVVYQSLKRLPEAEAYYQRSLDIRRELRDRIGEAQTLVNLGVVYRLTNRWQEAKEWLRQSLVISRETEDRLSEARTLLILARLEKEHTSAADALVLARQALRLLQTTQDTRTADTARRLIASWESNSNV